MLSISNFANEQIVSPGKILALKDLWADGPCVLFFLRRLGCAICRSYIRMFEPFREEYAQKGVRMVCLSFEAPGEGSDTDRSFAAGRYWGGEIYRIEKHVYQALFGRKTFTNSFFGLLDINKAALERSKETPGNLKGDGFQLGGQFVVGADGSVLVDHRQKAFGDDVMPDNLFQVLDSLTSTK
jgi:prostamide/prostaglandin F2alpha synthase